MLDQLSVLFFNLAGIEHFILLIGGSVKTALSALKLILKLGSDFPCNTSNGACSQN